MTAPRKRGAAKVPTQSTPADPSTYLPTPPAPALSPAEQAVVTQFETRAVDLTAECADARLERIEQTLAILAADRQTSGLPASAPHPDELGALRRIKAQLAKADPEDDTALGLIVSAFEIAHDTHPDEHAKLAGELHHDLARHAGMVSGPDLEAVVRLAERAAR